MRVRARTVFGLVLVLGVGLPAHASAACSPQQRADVRAAVATVAELRAAAAPGSADAAAVLARARRSCGDARFARAMAAATRSRGLPSAGQRVRMLGVDLVGVAAGGQVAWRFDVVRTAGRLAAIRSDAVAAVLRRSLRSAATGTRSLVWGWDPTRPRWDVSLQARVAAALARSDRATERAVAAASVRAVAPRVRIRTLARLDLVDHLRAANRFAYAAARSGDRSIAPTARAVALRAYIRVRAAHVRSWSRIAGSWSSLARHRLLVSQSRALLRRSPHAATATVVDALAAALTSSPTLEFDELPVAAFYPWPRDGAFDAQAVVVDPDKPVAATLSVYAPDSELVVRSIQANLVPGRSSLAWDGNGADGATLGPGEYRYAIDLVDPAGNASRIAGLEAFTIARDTTAPTVRSASVRHVAAAGSRRIIVAWEIVEVHSPKVTTSLVLQRGRTRRRVLLPDGVLKATVRRDISLSAGTWSATFTFLDGSGNRTEHAAGTFVVR